MTGHSPWHNLQREDDPRTMQIATTLAARIVAMADRDPLHPLVVAVRLALEIADARAGRRRALREASLNVAEAADWPALVRNHVPRDEVQRRRYPPHGDPAGWVAHGPAGEPVPLCTGTANPSEAPPTCGVPLVPAVPAESVPDARRWPERGAA